MFSCNFPYSELKSLTHTGNGTKYKLCNDVEENPGPVMDHVDPSKTIKTLYSQGGGVLYLDKMQDNNVLQGVYVL